MTGSAETPTTGGAVETIEVSGKKIFVKKVPLTATEATPENWRCTRNFDDVPVWFHYGISARGINAWRELEAHLAADAWAQAGGPFPRLYDWRVLPRPPRPRNTDVERLTAYWDDHPAIRRRLEALRDSEHDLVLHLEHLPGTLHDCVYEKDLSDAAVLQLERQLMEGAAWMRRHGMIHFDAHFQNIMARGPEAGAGLCFSDFGQALSIHFELSADERAFHDRHVGFDVPYLTTRLFNYTKRAQYRAVGEAMNAFYAELRAGPKALRALGRHFP